MQARRAALTTLLLNTFTVVSQQRPQHGVIEAEAVAPLSPGSRGPPLTGHPARSPMLRGGTGPGSAEKGLQETSGLRPPRTG